MVVKIMENGILIIDMDAIRWKINMVTVGVANTSMAIGKDMEHTSMLLEADILDNSWIIIDTGMEYTESQLEDMFITESGNRITVMGKDIRGGQMGMNIGESGKTTWNGVKV
jgi:hypothetical protein